MIKIGEKYFGSTRFQLRDGNFGSQYIFDLFTNEVYPKFIIHHSPIC